METPSLKQLALQVLERNRRGNQMETSSFHPPLADTPKVSMVETPLRQPLGVPAEWIDGVNFLRAMAPPADYSSKLWAALERDAQAFLSEWGARAAHINWHPLELFGVHKTRPAERFDAMGLVPCLRGAHVIELTERDATTESSLGARLTFARWPRLKQSEDRVLVWDLPAMKGTE